MNWGMQTSTRLMFTYRTHDDISDWYMAKLPAALHTSTMEPSTQSHLLVMIVQKLIECYS